MGYKICIDPGHYGSNYNKGAVAGYYESKQMWALAQELKSALQELGCAVVLTRTATSNPSLTARGKAATDCDAFVSLHSNAAAPEVRYVVVYHLVPHDGKLDEASKKLAQELSVAVGGTMDLPHKTAYRASENDKDGNGKLDDNYYTVLDSAFRHTKVPAVLIEHGFHTNPETASWLMKSANLQKLARAEAQAIVKALSGTTATPEAKPVTIAVAKEKEKVSGKHKVTANGGLKMRTSPVDGTVLQVVEKGRLVQYYGYFNTVDGKKWMLCVCDSKSGYMSAEYLQKI